MLELGNVLMATYNAYVISGAYNGLPESTADYQGSSVDDDTAVSIIQNLLHGQAAGSTETARNASEAISMVQTFEDATNTISEKLAQMEELTEQATSGTYSQEELAEMQQELEGLAEEINGIIENTEYNGNKLFTADGKTISISIGNSSAIDIAAKDLSFDIEGLDLTTEEGAEAALAFIQETIEQTTNYSKYLDTQAERLGKATTIIEFDIESEMGVDLSDFDEDLAREVAGYAASKAVEDISILFQSQANVTPAITAQLLEYTGQDVGEEGIGGEDTSDEDD